MVEFLGWTLSLPLHCQWLSDGTTKATNAHDEGLSPSVMRALATQTQRKSFFLFSVSLCLRGNFLSDGAGCRFETFFVNHFIGTHPAKSTSKLNIWFGFRNFSDN